MDYRNLIIVFIFVTCGEMFSTVIVADIVPSKPDQLIYLLGLVHNQHPETPEQFKTILKIVEEAEKKEEPEFHFLIEHTDNPLYFGTSERRFQEGDLNTCLLPELESRTLKNSKFEDIEVRYISNKADEFLKHPDIYSSYMERYREGRKDHDEVYTKQHFAQDLKKDYPTITPECLKIMLHGFQDRINKASTDESWAKFTKNVSLIKPDQSSVFFDDLTFGDVFDELQFQISDIENYMRTLDKEKDQFNTTLYGSGQPYGGIVGCLSALKRYILELGETPDTKVLAFSKALRDAKVRSRIQREIRNVNVTIFDLNLYRRIQQLRETSIKKIVVITGDAHRSHVSNLLNLAGLKKQKIFVDRDPTKQNCALDEFPLKIEYLKLLETPVKDLEDTLFVSSTSCTII